MVHSSNVPSPFNQSYFGYQYRLKEQEISVNGAVIVGDTYFPVFDLCLHLSCFLDDRVMSLFSSRFRMYCEGTSDGVISLNEMQAIRYVHVGVFPPHSLADRRSPHCLYTCQGSIYSYCHTISSRREMGRQGCFHYHL